MVVLATISYNVTIEGSSDVTCRVSLADKANIVITKSEEATQCLGTLTIDNPNLWWPYLMHPKPGYMYSLEVRYCYTFCLNVRLLLTQQ